MRMVVDRAIIDKECKELDLGNNYITSQGISIISKTLCDNHTLSRLYLSGNQINDEGVHYLTLTMNQSSLIVLGLSKNNITDTGAKYLADMLRENRSLIVLGLEDNEISDQGVELLANALDYNNRLQRLLLARNKLINGSSISTLIDLFRRNRSLKKLDLRDCNLSNSAKNKLQEVVKTNWNFELLY